MESMEEYKHCRLELVMEGLKPRPEETVEPEVEEKTPELAEKKTTAKKPKKKRSTKTKAKPKAEAETSVLETKVVVPGDAPPLWTPELALAEAEVEDAKAAEAE